MLIVPGVEVKTRIYESANSLVYRAIRQSDNEPVILKILKENYPTPQELARYRTEYQITKSLNLTGCIKAYDLKPYQNTLVMFVEDFGGESLKIWMKQKKFNLEEFLRIAIATTESLAFLHAANIIHKDINPSNIVFNPKNGQLKLIDFGISTKFTRENLILKNPHLLEGTLAYMSPEQTGRMNRSLDWSTDFYSLGVTFYEILTHQLPFDSTDALELVHYHIAKQPLQPSEINSQIPQVLSDIVMKLMAKTAEERYQSAFGIKADLERCLNLLQTINKISYFPLALQDISDKFQLPQKLYGREQEIETLLTAFERVSTRSELMLVSGYSGIGKSALVQEIYKPITQKRGYFISGKFDQFQCNIPYSAVVSALRELIKQLLTESETQLSQWRQKLLEQLGINGQVIVDVIPELELIIGKQSALPELGLNESQNRFKLVFQNFIKVFTKPEHPLVIFLDDLQWADSASLKLMQLLMSGASTGLFLIGAYRDNEVSSVHPLMLTVEEIAQTGAIIDRIYLSHLNLSNITQILNDTLNCQQGERTKPLAELILFKTGGNPFFMNEFLKSLYTERFLQFDLGNVQWQWNLEEIQAREFTDNVVELMVSKIKIQPENTQNLLKLAACIGNSFNLKTLGLISKKSIGEIALSLQAAIAENLVFPVSNMGDVELVIAATEFSVLPTAPSPLLVYKFVHDRIQQAAYSLIPDVQKPTTHYQIGQILLQEISPEAIEDTIFETINHLNYGTALITLQTERDKLAQLNLIACRKARSANAYQAGREYANTGLSLLGENAWLRKYEMTLFFHNLLAEFALIYGDFDVMEQVIETVIARATSLLDQVNVYRIRIQSMIFRSKLSKALPIALEFLQKLGIIFPTIPTQLDIKSSIAEVENLIGDREIEDLVHLPQMTDNEKIAIVQVVGSIMSVTYLSGSPLFPLVTILPVKLSIQYGNTSASALAYIHYSLIAYDYLKDVDTGIKFGHLAQNIASKMNAKLFKPQVLFIAQIMISHRQSYLKEILKFLQESYTSALEIGNYEIAGYAANKFCSTSFWCGESLVALEQETLAYYNILMQLNQVATANGCRLLWQLISNILGTTGQPNKLSEESFRESELLPRWLSVDNRLQICIFYLFKLLFSYFFGENESAKSYAVACRRYLIGISGMPSEPQFYFYESLILLAPLNAQSEQISEALEQVEQNQTELQQYWAKYAPMNHQHKVDLVAAEKCRVLGQKLETIDLYDLAIKGAKENGFIHEVALAYELAAKFYLSIDKELTAKAYMQEARHYYQLWGAAAKVNHLETQYPQIFVITQPPSKEISSTISTTGNRSSSSLDIDTVMKASEAISGEIVLDKLLSKLMKILIENVGAQSGYLILEQQGKLLIEAECAVDSEEVTVLRSIPVECCQKIAQSIVSYVTRTKEKVVLNNATSEGQFTNDPYIKNIQPKSILCAALINQGELSAIVYLENRLTTEAFTQARLEILQLLSGQAAIAITNAKLYAEVKERESRLTQFIDAMPIGVAVHDTTGQIIYANQTAHQLSGINIIPEANTEQFAEACQLYLAGTNQLYPTAKLPFVRSLAAETVKVDDIEFHRLDKIVSLEVSSTPIVDETGKINYAIAAFQDITERKQAENLLADYNRTLEQQVADRTLELQREIIERKRAEAAAQAANQAKSTFLANMSHELRTPLNAILGFSQLMNRSLSLSSQHHEYLGIISRNGEHLLTLINQVLDLSKIEAGRATLNETNFDFHRLLKDIENMFQYQAENKGLQLLIERSFDVPQYLRTDETKLRQILINLLSNAIKFTSSGGISARVKFQPLNSQIYFEIEDTGDGIAADELKNLFEAFLQTKTGEKAQEGTGLGLAIARSFVQLMGGDMTVTSQVDRGTLFKFNIKAKVVKSVNYQQEQATRRAIALAPNQPRYRLLIVDDALDNRQLLVKLLSPFGFEIAEATNGVEAIKMWEQYSPHLIFMDMRMPVMDGYEAAKQIKNTIKGEATAIIAVTASSFEEEKAVVYPGGCDDFIRKPFKEEYIFDILQKHIGVQLVFEEFNAITVSNENEVNILTKSALAALPPELLINLQQAISNLDLGEIQIVIDEIQQIDRSLTSAIAASVRNFQYEQLLNLISSLLKI
ncbi:MAG TPA: AAA family ATPase [Leptolyngbyaceae cyanobacterium]